MRTLGTLFLIVLCVAALAFFGRAFFMQTGPTPLPFDSALWHDQHEVYDVHTRLRMVDDLLNKTTFEGMSTDDVQKLLGLQQKQTRFTMTAK